jgi:hypothetical protein
MPIPIVEAWHVEQRGEPDYRETPHPASLHTITVDEARDEVVTLELAGSHGVGTQTYEIDLSPSGADELALWLIRRAEEARAEIRTARWEKRRRDDERHHSSGVDLVAAKQETRVDPGGSVP